MNGLIGEVIFEGDIKEFVPFIKIGEIIHIGRSCAFGMGKYICEFNT